VLLDRGGVGWIVGDYDSIGGDIYRLLVITVAGNQLLAIAIEGEVVVGDYDCGDFSIILSFLFFSILPR